MRISADVNFEDPLTTASYTPVRQTSIDYKRNRPTTHQSVCGRVKPDVITLVDT